MKVTVTCSHHSRVERRAMLEELDAFMRADRFSREAIEQLFRVREHVEHWLALQDDMACSRALDHPRGEMLRRHRSHLPRLFDACEHSHPREALMARLRLVIMIRRIIGLESERTALTAPPQEGIR